MSVTAPDRASANASPPPQGDAERAKQLEQADAPLFAGVQPTGFAKALFRGEFRSSVLFPYPDLPADQREETEEAVARVRAFADAEIDAAAIDRQADIPRSVINGLSRLGVMGMTAPKEFGGRGFSQSAYCRVMEVIGGPRAPNRRLGNAPPPSAPPAPRPFRAPPATH